MKFNNKAPFQNKGFRSGSCLNPASTLLGKEGGGSIIGPEHIASVLEEEVSLSAVAESFPRISLVK